MYDICEQYRLIDETRDRVDAWLEVSKLTRVQRIQID